ncbi:hypothetical protein AGMMS49573_01390 [Endomicrobiia bacterium]|uniref:DUF362 domain-containing protein n=1 Tax=Endomicrobium trichonymphae TaxID=1408204 RepID=UPI0008652E57|nr:DUF362 domain-containing protein [Candidatus Endomicrobium trichonymphae]GHT06089.1 hypothetical protein AGMMS49523_06880 [Endomicrobiia bacterium]BAV59133.1 conserved ferredoxin domain protein [Candidatus Endomicrobium trichonymphae]GHT13368.1 hypothetical protein AGMMS49571_06960 [Endomicrobiia bacterium]GHT15318.1 hypothetical protein AGMMS49573_01390 [Endomicrobiia bacterium]GHT20794.1 hypothetical protein AGMMS49929_08340 [Endomicrobiia bacterium]
MSVTKISLIKCDDYSKADNAVREAVRLLGCISVFISPSEKILIKPNLLSPKDPSKAITTHPEIVRVVIKLVKEAGAVPAVGDSPGGAIRNIKNLWETTQMERICKEENVELINFEASGSKEFDINDKNIKKVNFSNAALDCDGIINLPKLKTHALMSFSAGVKNLYGLVPGLMKVEYHKYAFKSKDFADLLTNIYLFFKDKIRFTLIDGVLSMEGNGPSAGEVRKTNLIAASSDTAVLDAYLLNELNYDISNSGILKNLKITKDILKTVEVSGEKSESFNLKKFKFPSVRKLDLFPKSLIRILGKFLWVKADINEKICVKCMLCARACPVEAIRAAGNQYPHIDAEKCISCFCCHEMCPHKAVKFKKSMLAKIFIKEN